MQLVLMLGILMRSVIIFILAVAVTMLGLIWCVPDGGATSANFAANGVFGGVSGGGGIAFVGEYGPWAETTSQQAQVSTVGSVVTQGNVLIVTAMRENTDDTVASVTDSQGNTYTVEVAGRGGPQTAQRMAIASGYMTTGLATDDTVTVTWTNGAAYNYFATTLAEFSGIVETNKADQMTSANAVSTSIDSGEVTTTVADELLFAYLVRDRDEVVTEDVTYTEIDGPTHSSTQYYAYDFYKIVTSTGTYDFTATVPTSDTWHVILQTYKGQ